MRIAIIGSGVSGLVTARLLHGRHDVTVFEARDRVGGHVNTVTVEDHAGRSYAVDTGFIVYNEVNYPRFTKLLDRLGVVTQPSDMSFGVRNDRTGVEYSSASLRTLFAQKRNLVRPRFHGMLREILRFNREAGPAIRNGQATLALGTYLERNEFSPWMVENYLLPMASALWSIPRTKVLELPTDFFVRFFENHGMLTVDDQPEWRVVAGGSARYVEALTEPFRDRIRTGTPVSRVERHHAHVTVDGASFDHVVFACHSDQALRILADPSRAERDILASLPYQDNEVVLHTDPSVLPAAHGARAAWNYHVHAAGPDVATVTYDMNRLQTLDANGRFLVSLNASEWIDPEAILYRTRYRHPVYTRVGTDAQERWEEINGIHRTHYCGAYWGFGFHEDGVRSAVRVAERFGASL